MKDQQEKNPQEYGYAGDELITMTSKDFITLRQILGKALSRETNVFFPEKYQYVNRDTGDVIKTVNEKNKSVAMKIVDVDATRNSNPAISRTIEGMELLEAELMMGRIHIEMVETGVAKHQSYFEKAPVGEGVFAPKENESEKDLKE